MLKEFKRLKSVLDIYKYDKCEWEYLAALTIFFCLFKFQLLDQVEVKTWLTFLLRFLDCRNQFFLNKISTFFELHLKYFF